MKKIDVAYGIFSLGIPLLVYSSLLFLDPVNVSGRAFSASFLASNAFGFALSVVVLARSDLQTLDTSPLTRWALLLAVIGIFANTVAFEITLFFRPGAF